MKRILRSFAVGLLAGGLVGLWFGMNIGKDQPLLSNPFDEVTLSEQLDRTARSAADEADKAVDRAGDAVQQAGEAVENAM